MSAIKKSLIKLFDKLGIFRLLQWHNRNQPLILMYHRITDEQHAAGLAPQEFEKQIAYIAQRFRVVPINILLNELREGTQKPFTLALTFDDGHADFYQQAWPILRKYKLPASLYVTTGFVDGSHWLWPDLLKYILIHNQQSELVVEGVGTILTRGASLQNAWHMLGDYGLTLTTDTRNNFLNKLATQAGVAIPTSPQSPFAAVSWSQLQEMQAQGLDVGSHTVSHPILSTLDTNTLIRELQVSADAISAHLGKTPIGLCYPNGRLIDINPTVITYAQQTGYQYGLLGRNIPLEKSNPFLIGRLAANTNFTYFKWSLARREKSQEQNYIN